MTVKAILDSKGRDVVTIAPDKSLAEAAQLLAGRGIGAVVVTSDGGRIAGILSERDIVRVVGQDGAAALKQPISSVMTAKVQRCEEHHTVNEVMQIMTQGRFRHLPVEHDGRIAGIISIGDVVKKRIEEVEREAEDIRSYIATA
ncbi:CBS domain-containing protein [Nitratireductor soli]|uniref:CBS domain-containing protein n=1 Tax=Nitratireductor soli TaxID=1670619 RepID=UPI00065DD16E|nr:CBS domain-containing protein [Nitratireductor soli]